jgi:histidinol phosphatase-like PHP family hydrolase
MDNHVHTELAYCSENMTVEKSIALAHDFGLSGVTFTEHSGQLYFDRQPYWRNAWLDGGVDAVDEKFNRMDKYLELKRNYESDYAGFSLEVECDARGRMLLKEEDVPHFDGIMGTIHALPGLTKDVPPQQREIDDFLFMADALGKQGVKVLAHPLRVFMRAGWDAPSELFEPTARLLSHYHVAAELNIHANNRPPKEFIQSCIKLGVKFSFGSDSHSLAEIGDFTYHIALLRDAGYDGDISDVLIDQLR